MSAPPSAVPERIDGAAVLDSIAAWLARFVAYPSEHALHAHAVWIAHTHALECFENTPRIAFLSPEPGSGKSRALEVTEPLVRDPMMTVNMSTSALFRSIAKAEDMPPTVLFDEVDSVFTKRPSESTEELRGMLNSGYRRGAMVMRSVVKGKEIEVERSPTFCAVALAGLDDLPDTLMTRAVVVRMQRRSPTQPIQPYRRRVTAGDALELQERIAAWTAQERAALLDVWPDLPESITDRNADVWEPLIAIADAAGGEWPQRAREAALMMIAEQGNRPPTVGIRLLGDIRRVFTGDRMRTTDLLHGLTGLETAPWGGMLSGQPIDARYLARKLARYEIATGTAIRFSDGVHKGYRREHFADAWARYLPEEDAPKPAEREPELFDSDPF